MKEKYVIVTLSDNGKCEEAVCEDTYGTLYLQNIKYINKPLEFHSNKTAKNVTKYILKNIKTKIITKKELDDYLLLMEII